METQGIGVIPRCILMRSFKELELEPTLDTST
jgi:hypothetical protein